MSDHPLVSIIVPSRTGWIDALRVQLSRQSFQDWELIVGAGSNPAIARNHGASVAKGRYLIFLDDDVQLGHARHLESLVEALRTTDPNDAIGVPCRLRAGSTATQRRYFKHASDVALRVDQRMVSVWWHGVVGGACVAFHRRLFDALGGYDEQLVSGEDYEILYRLWHRGGRIYALTDSWVCHEPTKNVRVAIQKTLWYERGNAQVARKHPEANYRLSLSSRWHAAGYLLLRTVCLLPLIFVEVSFHHRRPRLAFRPIEACLSYLGAWAYCISWFTPGDHHRPVSDQAPAEARGGTASPRHVLREAHQAKVHPG